jgi:hypothetical protein
MISPAGFSEGDVFAALILACSTSFTDRDSEELVMHINGCSSMVQAMSQRSKYTATSDVFTVFEPFVQDYIRTLSLVARYASPCPAGPVFKKRLSYKRELLRAGDLPIHDKWMGYYTLNSILETVIHTTYYCLCRISLDEGSEQTLRRYTLEYIQGELKDPDLGQTWKQLQLSGELYICCLISINFGILELAEALLTMPEILPGLLSPLIAGMACKLVSYIRDLTGKDPAYRASFVQHLRSYRCLHLGLASLALPVEDIPICELQLLR